MTDERPRFHAPERAKRVVYDRMTAQFAVFGSQVDAERAATLLNDGAIEVGSLLWEPFTEDVAIGDTPKSAPINVIDQGGEPVPHRIELPGRLPEQVGDDPDPRLALLSYDELAAVLRISRLHARKITWRPGEPDPSGKIPVVVISPRVHRVRLSDIYRFIEGGGISADSDHDSLKQ